MNFRPIERCSYSAILRSVTYLFILKPHFKKSFLVNLYIAVSTYCVTIHGWKCSMFFKKLVEWHYIKNKITGFVQKKASSIVKCRKGAKGITTMVGKIGTNYRKHSTNFSQDFIASKLCILYSYWVILGDIMKLFVCHSKSNTSEPGKVKKAWLSAECGSGGTVVVQLMLIIPMLTLEITTVLKHWY